MSFTSHNFIVFLPARRNVKMSAVCQYSLRDVQTAFDGPYMELLDTKWREYTGTVPEPRPGSVRCTKSK